MSLDRSIAGKYNVGVKGRSKLQSSLTVGLVYLLDNVRVMLIGYEDDKALVQDKLKQVKKVEKNLLKKLLCIILLLIFTYQ